jgi:uncharacterized membrane protein
MPKARVEAFSDAVFAIAITLLDLEIAIPNGPDRTLWHDLKDQWPSYAAYLVSFFVIGIIWINHHGIFTHITKVDYGVLYINLALLATVAFIPFPTALFAEHLRSGADEEVAAAVYSGSLALMGLSSGALWLYIPRHPSLHSPSLTAEEIARTNRVALVGAPAFIVAIAIAFVSPALTLVIIAGVAAFYAVAGRTPGHEEEQESSG